MMKKAISALAIGLLLLSALCGCKTAVPPVTTGEIGVLRDTRFGAVLTELSIEEFCQKGFVFGDSVDVVFDNGYCLEDIPFYNGYYAKTGAPLACGYPGYPHVSIAFAQGDSAWEVSGVTEESKMTVTLRERGKYLLIQETFGQTFSNERSDFPSDEAFANFRALSGGRLKANTFYRSASPCDNKYNRAALTDALSERVGIQYVLNLAEDEEALRALMAASEWNSPYYQALYERGQVALLGLKVNYRSEQYAKGVARGLVELCQHEGPVLLHCLEGKDRTGFVCALLLALAGADAEEIIEDYMVTYQNCYQISKERTPDKYEAILSVVVNDFLYCLTGQEEGSDLSGADLEAGAKSYLRFGGLTEEQIATLVAYISE